MGKPKFLKTKKQLEFEMRVRLENQRIQQLYFNGEPEGVTQASSSSTSSSSSSSDSAPEMPSESSSSSSSTSSNTVPQWQQGVRWKQERTTMKGHQGEDTTPVAVNAHQSLLVKYIHSEDGRAKYGCKLGQCISRNKDGLPLNTASYKEKAVQKALAGEATKALLGIGVTNLRSDKWKSDDLDWAQKPNSYGNDLIEQAYWNPVNRLTWYLPQKWFRESMIYVMRKGTSGAEVLTAVGRNNYFHHSSFLAGGEVLCAGEWIVRKGRLHSISANSGHYRPSLGALKQAVRLLVESLHHDTTVLLFDRQAAGGRGHYVEMPASEFLKPSASAPRYATCAHAAFP